MSSVLGIFFKIWWSRDQYKIFFGTVNVWDGELFLEVNGSHLGCTCVVGDSGRHKLVTFRMILSASSQSVSNHVFFPLFSLWGVDCLYDHLSRSDLVGSLSLWAFGCLLLSLCHALYLPLISVGEVLSKRHNTRSQTDTTVSSSQKLQEILWHFKYKLNDKQQS